MSAVDAYALAGRGRRESDALVMRHAELVKRIAYHLAGRLPPSVDVEDLIQAGMLGLLEAASNYSSGRGASFETYAGIRIRGSMIDALRKLDWAPAPTRRYTSLAVPSSRRRSHVERAPMQKRRGDSPPTTSWCSFSVEVRALAPSTMSSPRGSTVDCRRA